MNKNNLVYLAIATVVLSGLFYVLKPKSSTILETTPLTQIESSSSAQATSSAQFTNVKTFDLVIKNKKLTSGLKTLKVTEGDQVIINIISDEDDELHIHGYDKSTDLTANISSKLEFIANLTGRFPYELEKSKTEIGVLEVQPK